jgi:uncharacterized protein
MALSKWHSKLRKRLGLAASVNPDCYKQGQANWRKSVRDACTDAACLSRVYQERLRELK